MSQLLYSATRRQGKAHPQWSTDAVLYELNLRQFTPQGTFAAAAAHLPRLKTLGVDIIWLMPIFPIGQDRRKGTLGSYYSIRDYYGINPEFGDHHQMKSFVEAAHNNGMRVILDWVANHTSRDAVWTVEHPQWYEWDEARNEIATPFDWNDTAKLNYDNHDMRCEMVEALKFWLRETGIDGYRCDMAMLVPIDFWHNTIPQLQAVREDLFMLAEAEGPEFHAAGFDATYGWELHHLLCDIAVRRANANDLANLLISQAVAYPSDAISMQFTSNHDENSWNGSEYERLGNMTIPMAALTFILPGMPLIYNGQETAMNRRLEFFDKDLIAWKNDTYIEKLYTSLTTLKHSHPALKAANAGADLIRIDNSQPSNILTLKRKIGDRVVIALFNLAWYESTFRVYDADFCGEYYQIGSSETAELFSDRDFYLPGNGWFIYYK